MVRFRLFGIPVTVLPWFWITLAIIGSGTIHSGEDLFKLVLFVLAGFISVLVHELGHALTIRKFGAPTEIVLQAFGGFATYPRNRFNRKQDFLVTAAGPAIQIALGLLIGLLAYQGGLPNSMGLYFLQMLAIISIVWAVFNLLPIFPLDGGQMLKALLGPKCQKVTYGIGLAIAVGAGLLGLMGGLILVTLFMALFAYQNFQLLRNPEQQP
ncbi:site-2 protease family protein [Roseibacillus ishigakijimensis]|uniref:Site-2 protease family protein n=1 Tax=Roseibacillus ishigakijimensis TaxID=454146 RepID=A0A934RQ74_9BACT|nr:site-2 protease family protein [Roseibacillus ishigakijimensis]MBK1833079.1 site-2 protease family protein [Roseibacillus ishigakijimensis]